MNRKLFNTNLTSGQLITEIKKEKKNNKFDQYINKITFPFYKNFSEYSEINFNFPLTILVGKNGSGKSSILHALYGAPEGYNVSRFWFSTSVDPIKDGNGDDKRHCFVYNYTDINRKIDKKNVAYARASRPGTKTKKKDFDYWETQKLTRKYKVEDKQRVHPIYEKPLYMDFRSELSSYDKFFYFEEQETMKMKKNDYVRSKVSKNLKYILDSPKNICLRKNKKQNDPMFFLCKEEVKIISWILGNNYSRIKLVKHRLYRGKWGITVMLLRDGFEYSEAHAGSGEFSICMLVHNLYSTIKSKNHHLILLDEPECSLYPGAQSRFLNFLLDYILVSHNQVVISSHSAHFIRNLPEDAVKRIFYNNVDGKTYIEDHCLETEAFNEFEMDTTKCKIYCEDNATKILLTECMNTSNNNIYKIVNVIATTNSEETIVNSMIFSSAMQNTKNCFYFLDGDKTSSEIEEFINCDKYRLNKILKDPEQINDITNAISSQLPLPSSKPRENEDEKTITEYDELKDTVRLAAQKKFLCFFYNHVYYLPKTDNDFGTPESIIFGKYAKDTADGLEVDRANINSTNQIKIVFDKMCDKKYGEGRADKNDRNALLKEFAHRWAMEKNDSFISINESLSKIVEIYNKSLGD
ncbi:ATP-binding protein [Lactobacillus mellis]|nr:ATP-binding protein [Bombilactobacillus mellis]